eukprot:snap_masked-scaffold23_size669530-processed-gene-5.1 protein:Tk11076 transcript:snap_masked-scaffold23_size669530-processed-gene-5.1-mRNA-1 annotation:"hypothetical protein LOTGIDRAFT_234625"
MAKVLPSDTFTAFDRHDGVKLRIDKSAHPDGMEPVTVPSLLQEVANEIPNKVALSVKRDGEWINWTYYQYHQEVRAVAKGFIKLGLEPRKAVGIIGFNSPEWFISDLAAVFANGIATGIYPTNSIEACKYIVNDSQMNIVVVEDQRQLDKFLAVKPDLAELKAIIQYSGTPKAEGVLSWSDLLALGNKESDVELDQRLDDIYVNQCCHLVYTSGTTGSPKGVMLSHDNLTYTATTMIDGFGLRVNEETIVSYLPLSHVAANVTDIFLMIAIKGTTYFADKDALKGTLTNTLKEVGPTLFMGVPRVWEKIYEKMVELGKGNTGLKKQIGTWAKKQGFVHNQNVIKNQANSKSFQYKLADKLVFQKVKAALGLQNCDVFYSAAAPLAPNIIEYFMSLDMRVLEIYGMSECSGPQASNVLHHQRVGSIGKTLEGFHSKIDPEESEIRLLGRNIMMGYLGDETKTLAAFDAEGWLKSGDIGREDPDDFLFITGRLKEILITAGGENVAPILIENTLKKHLPAISNVMVIGDKRKFLSCLLTLKVEVDQDSMEPLNTLSKPVLEWCEEIGSKAKTAQEAIDDDVVRRAIQEGINRANEEAISNAQRVQKWKLIPKDFSIPGGELGPTMKLKRHVVLEYYANQITAIYR